MQLDPAPEGGREPNLTLCTVGRCCSSDSGLKGARALSRFLRLFASCFACYLHIWSELRFFSLPALHFFFFLYQPTGPLRYPPHSTKHQAVTFFFSFYCPSPGKGLPGSASKSLSCCNGAVRPSRKMRNWECTEVKEKASPGKGLPLVLGVLATAGQGHPALITRPGRRRGTEREF